MCDQGPALLVNDKVFTRVTPEKVAEIVAEYRAKGTDEAVRTSSRRANELTYAGIEPDAGLKAALALSRGDIVDNRLGRRLKGRGGAGFPTGMKWNFCAAEKSDQQVTSSVTPTKASPGPSRTASSCATSPTWCSRA